MPHNPHRLAFGILRNAGALSLIGAVDKGAGLIVAVLVARFLGPDAMGLFALLYSAAMLIQIIVTLGMSESLVQEVAARAGSVSTIHRAALKVVLLASLPVLAVCALAAALFVDSGVARNCILIIAVGAPLSGAFGVSQAALQGLERVRFLTLTTFAVRALSLVFLAAAFRSGRGLEFAFVATALFHFGCLVPFFAAIRASGPHADSPEPSGMVGRAVPFALNRTVRELGLRLPSLVLPALVGLVSAGIFDAANRVRNTLGVVVSSSITGLTPAFARALPVTGPDRDRLVGFTTKYMCIGMSLLATAIVVLADWIIDLLFGSRFAGAKLAMQILAWSQVLNAADAVLQQAMLTSNHGYGAMRNTAIVLAAQLAFILVLTAFAGTTGAALGVLLSSALAVVLDLRFVSGRIAPIPAIQFVLAPLAAVSVVASLLLLADGAPLAVRASVAVVAWLATMVVFGVMPSAELRFARRIVSQRHDR